MFISSRVGRRQSVLWRNTNFLHLWSAETVAQFGTQLSIVALPLIAALMLNATPFEMGLLTAAGQFPRLVIGFFAGAWVDRLRRQPIMRTMDFGRAITYAMIPIAAMAGILDFWLLLTIALIGGCQAVFFDAAWSAFIPHIVERKHLSDANGKLMASVSLAQVLGPALAGTLIAWLTGPMVMTITALTFALSGWFITMIRTEEPRRPKDAGNPTRLIQEVREGFQELLGSKVVRPLTTSAAVLNLGGWIFLSVYVLYMADDLGLSSTGIGLVFACGGAGALVGSMIAAPLAVRFGVGRSILVGAIVFGFGNLLVPLAILVPDHALPLVVASETIAWLSLQVFNINRFSLRQALTPDHLLGRVSSSTMTIIGGVQMVGSLLGGIIGQVFSVHVALVIGTIGMFMAAWWIWDSPVPGIRTMPEQPEATFTETDTALASTARM
ncbi:MAG TPA: MFS transporter [Thermomicrobiales bacterium]|nr:MFS transporter [Thermomicrobiales bacterium]